MTRSTTCRRCGAPIEFESGAEVVRCRACGAVRAADDEPPLAAEPVEDEPPETEMAFSAPAPSAARPTRAARTARADDSLATFADGCYWARVGVLCEALAVLVAIAVYGFGRAAPDALTGGAGGPSVAVLFPALVFAFGTALVAWGRSRVLALGRGHGAETVLAVATGLAFVRALLAGFAAVSLAVAVIGGKEYEAAGVRGTLAAPFAGCLGLLAEFTALTGLAAAAAVRGPALVLVSERALAAVLALQVSGCGALLIAALFVLRSARTSDGAFEIVAVAAYAAFYLWIVYAQYAPYSAGAAVPGASVGGSRRKRTNRMS